MNIFQKAADAWLKHGTKILGAAATLLAGLQAAAVLQPDLFNATLRASIAAANAALGIWTVKRGTYNTEQIADKVIQKQMEAPINVQEKLS